MAQLMGCAIIIYLSVYRIYAFPGAAGMLSSADELTLPAYYDDLRRGIEYSQGWYFSAARHYVPDFVVYALFRWITGNFRHALALVGVIQPLAWFAVGQALYRAVGGRSGGTFTLLFCTWWAALVAYATWFAPGLLLEFFGYSVALAFHFGPYLTALAGFLLYLWYIRTGRTILLLGSCATLVLVVASDLWFMLYFAIPALGTAGIAFLRSSGRSPRQLVYGLTTGAALLVAFLVYQQITPASQNYISRFSLGKSIQAVGILAGDVEQALAVDPVFVGVFVLLPLGIGLIIVAARAGSARFFRSPWPPVGGDGLTALFLFAGVSWLATAMFTFGFHLYVDYAAMRYLHPLIYTPTLLVLITLGLAIERRAPKRLRATRGGLAMAVATMTVSIIVAQPALAPAAVFPSPEYVSCFDGMGTAAGLAEYWQAKPLLMYSDRRLQVVSIETTGAAYLWGANATWYTDSWIHPGEPPAFRFILMKGLDPSAITTRYGAPDRIAGCADTEIWFYDQPNRLFQGLVNSSAELRRRVIQR